jgi:hypothetical protein
MRRARSNELLAGPGPMSPPTKIEEERRSVEGTYPVMTLGPMRAGKEESLAGCQETRRLTRIGDCLGKVGGFCRDCIPSSQIGFAGARDI